MKIVALLCFLVALHYATADKRVVCYFASWTVYRLGDGSFDVKDIDPNLCTHINFGFVGLNEDASINILDSWESNEGYRKVRKTNSNNGFENLVKLKSQNPRLKVLVSMGGWNEGSKRYSRVAADPEKRKTLAANVLKFIEQYQFDGFDLDWEYPGLRGGDDSIDKDDFTELLKELHKLLKPQYILSAAVASAKEKIEVAYDVPEISKLLDYLNVMGFDFHGAFDHSVGHISPLYPAKVDYDFENNATYNVDTAITYWIENGAPPEKLNLGVPLYGRSFTLEDPKNNDLFAPIEGPGKAGPYSGQEGILGYNEICLFHNDSTYVWDNEQKVPHRIWDDQWVGFDDEKSIQLKMEYALNKSLGGAMVWSFDYDDFRGKCGAKYPLLTAVNKYIHQ